MQLNTWYKDVFKITHLARRGPEVGLSLKFGGGKPKVHGRVQQPTSHNIASALPRFRTTYDPRRTSNKRSVARTVGVLDSRLLWAENTPTRPHAPRAFPTTVTYSTSIHPARRRLARR